jgi:hypothetical protein
MCFNVKHGQFEDFGFMVFEVQFMLVCKNFEWLSQNLIFELKIVLKGCLCL